MTESASGISEKRSVEKDGKREEDKGAVSCWQRNAIYPSIPLSRFLLLPDPRVIAAKKEVGRTPDCAFHPLWKEGGKRRPQRLFKRPFGKLVAASAFSSSSSASFHYQLQAWLSLQGHQGINLLLAAVCMKRPPHTYERQQEKKGSFVGLFCVGMALCWVSERDIRRAESESSGSSIKNTKWIITMGLLLFCRHHFISEKGHYFFLCFCSRCLLHLLLVFSSSSRFFLLSL